MKKILSLVLAMMMVLSMANVAFAAPEDVTDKNQQKAVDALMSLGIVTGYEDGSYKPEKVVTRAEMAKLIVTALGHGDLAQGSESSFKDAKGTWYDGYVAMAAGLEIVTGYPDGTFKGENTVSYQEAVVMTLRALGYTNSAVNNGADVYNAAKYKALGATLGVFKNVVFKNGGANRGDIAVMLYNALECDTVKVNEKGLAEKIVADEYYEPVYVDGVKTDRTTKVTEHEILLDRLVNKVVVKVTPNSINPKNKDYLGNLVDLEKYMYQTITAYTNDDKEVVFVKRVNSKTVEGRFKLVTSADNAAYKKDTLRVLKADKSYDYVDFDTTKKVPVYWNGEQTKNELTFAEVNSKLNKAIVTVVLDDEYKATAIIAEKSTKSILADTGYKANSVTLGSILLPKNGSKIDLEKITIEGDVTSLEDIKRDDVITSYAAGGDAGTVPTKIKLVVTRDSIEGKVTKVNQDGYYAVINGEEYYNWYIGEAAFGGDYWFSKGDEGTFYFDAAGTIFAFRGKSVTSSDYALVAGIKAGVNVDNDLIKSAYLKMIDKDGKSATYNFNSAAQFEIDGLSSDVAKTAIFQTVGGAVKKHTFVNALNPVTDMFDTANGDTLRGKYAIVSYTLNDDNEITYVKFAELKKLSVNPNDKKFTVASNCAIFESHGSVAKLVSVEDLPTTAGGESFYAVIDENGDFMVIIANKELVNRNTYAIIVDINTVTNSDNTSYDEVIAYVKGQEVTLQTTKNVSLPYFDDVNAQLFKLTMSGGKISATITPNADAEPAQVSTSSGIGVSNFKVVNSTKGIFDAVKGNLKGQRFILDKDAAIYVYEPASWDLNYPNFTRVGDINDVEYPNSEVLLYDIDGDNEIDVVIVKVLRNDK